jgi:transcriptional regulator with XRE-family HTH domain
MPIDPEKLKALRKKRNLSQKSLAEAADVSQPVISAAEAGQKPNMSITVLQRIAGVVSRGSVDALLKN